MSLTATSSLAMSAGSSPLSTERESLSNWCCDFTDESTKPSLERGSLKPEVSPLPLMEMKLQARLAAVEAALERRCGALESKVSVLARTAVRDTASIQKQLQELHEQMEATTFLLQSYRDQEASRAAEPLECVHLEDTMEPQLRGLREQLDQRCSEISSVLALGSPGADPLCPIREASSREAGVEDPRDGPSRSASTAFEFPQDPAWAGAAADAGAGTELKRSVSLPPAAAAALAASYSQERPRRFSTATPVAPGSPLLGSRSGLGAGPARAPGQPLPGGSPLGNCRRPQAEQPVGVRSAVGVPGSRSNTGTPHSVQRQVQQSNGVVRRMVSGPEGHLVHGSRGVQPPDGRLGGQRASLHTRSQGELPHA